MDNINNYLPDEIKDKLITIVEKKLITNVHFDEETENAYWFETKDNVYSGKVSVIIKDEKINCKWNIDHEEDPYTKIVENPDLSKNEILKEIAEWLKSGIPEEE